jgi:hypothetical protein
MREQMQETLQTDSAEDTLAHPPSSTRLMSSISRNSCNFVSLNVGHHSLWHPVAITDLSHRSKQTEDQDVQEGYLHLTSSTLLVPGPCMYTHAASENLTTHAHSCQHTLTVQPRTSTGTTTTHQFCLPPANSLYIQLLLTQNETSRSKESLCAGQAAAVHCMQIRSMMHRRALRYHPEERQNCGLVQPASVNWVPALFITAVIVKTNAHHQEQK